MEGNKSRPTNGTGLTIKEQLIRNKLEFIIREISALGKIGVFIKITNELMPKAETEKPRAVHRLTVEDFEVRQVINTEFSETIEVELKLQAPKMKVEGMNLRG